MQVLQLFLIKYSMIMINNWTDKDLIKLSILRNFKSAQFRKIVERFDDFNTFAESEVFGQIFQNIFRENLHQLEDLAEIQLQKLQEHNSRLISIWDDEYPDLLKKTSSPPSLLYVKGKLHNDKQAIAIVGTRKSTGYGKLTTERFSEFFVANNIIVVSGLAYGIDTISHLATVKAGGVTYAVIPSSIDTISPFASQKNAEKIVEGGGAIISEYRFGVQAILASFPQRNRIIAGISLATIVVECGIKSGALITAKIAASESREVFAVPGNISSTKSEGTNKLIKDNLAIIALSPESVMEDLGLTRLIQERNFEDHGIKFDDPQEEILYNILNFEPIHIDNLADKSEMDFSSVSGKLLMLEFKGLIKQLPGKYYLRTHI